MCPSGREPGLALSLSKEDVIPHTKTYLGAVNIAIRNCLSGSSVAKVLRSL